MRIFGLKHGLYFACVKGEPILTTAAFVSWIDDNSDYQVSLETGRWLHELGYSRVHHQKGVYFDGHDKEDVVKERKVFLEKMNELDNDL